MRTVHQAVETNLGFVVSAHGHGRIPIRGGTPIVFDVERLPYIRLAFHHNGVNISPFGVCAKVAHRAECQVDVGA